jgi:hypothetical protein
MYAVKIEPKKRDEYVLTLSDTVNGLKRTRVVSNLAHASTWLEAWSQSGFAALEEVEENSDTPDESRSPTPTVGKAVTTKAVDPKPLSGALKPSGTDEYSRTQSSLYVLGGPNVFLTELGNLFVGGQLAIMHREQNDFVLGVGAGFVTQVHPSDVSRRLYWIGPQLGYLYRLSNTFDLTPSLGIGLLGTSARTTTTATALGAYGSIGSQLSFRWSSKFSAYAGVELMLLSAKLFGSSSGRISTTEIDDGETETEYSSATLEPSSGVANVGLSVGVKWDLGGLT